MKKTYALLFAFLQLIFFPLSAHHEGFLPNTLVHSTTTVYPIQKLAVFDTVIGRNHERKHIIATTKLFADRYIRLTFADAVLSVGCHQPLCINIHTWINAEDLSKGDTLLDISGNHHLILNTELICDTVILHALTVEDQLFCVEPYGLLVHNMAAALGTASLSLGAITITNPVTAAIGATLALSIIADRALRVWHNQCSSASGDVPESITFAERLYYEARTQQLEQLHHELLRIEKAIITLKALGHASCFTYQFFKQAVVAPLRQNHPWLTITKNKELSLTKAQQRELRALRQHDLLMREHAIIQLQTKLAVHSNELITQINTCCTDYQQSLPTLQSAFDNFNHGCLDIKAIGHLYALLIMQDYKLDRITRIIQEACVIGDYYQHLEKTGGCTTHGTTLIETWHHITPCIKTQTALIHEEKQRCGQRLTAVEQYLMRCGGTLSTLKNNITRKVEKYLGSYDATLVSETISKLETVTKEATASATLPQEDAKQKEEKKPAKTVEDLIADAKPWKEKNFCKQFIKEGGYEQALKDFESLNPTQVKNITKSDKVVKVGVLADEREVNVRQESSATCPTLEIGPISGTKDKKIKFRYGQPKY